MAIQWIASEFAKAGLKPLVGDSYLQPVPLIEFTADRALTSLVVRHGDKSKTYHAPDATANFANEVIVNGAVVFAGYGISAPELGYDDYAGIDVTGKVVLISATNRRRTMRSPFSTAAATRVTPMRLIKRSTPSATGLSASSR